MGAVPTKSRRAAERRRRMALHYASGRLEATTALASGNSALTSDPGAAISESPWEIRRRRPSLVRRRAARRVAEECRLRRNGFDGDSEIAAPGVAGPAEIGPASGLQDTAARAPNIFVRNQRACAVFNPEAM